MLLMSHLQYKIKDNMQLHYYIALEILCVKLNEFYIITMIFSDLNVVDTYAYVCIVVLICKNFDLQFKIYKSI